MATANMDSTRLIEDFSLPASTGQTLGLSSFKGKVPLVLVFLSDLESTRDQELLAEINHRLYEFGAARSQVLGSAKVTARSAREFVDEKDLNVALLADASGSMARDYQADDDEGNTRTIAVIADRDGRLIRRFDPLPVDDGATATVGALLDTVRAIGSGALTPPDEA